MKSMVSIKTEFEGFHKYPDAPKEVEFLKNRHRHIFKVRVWIEVFSNNRDIEFIFFKRFVQNIIKIHDFDYKSCEMISDDLFKTIRTAYPERDIWIEITEDGENGSFKMYDKKDLIA